MNSLFVGQACACLAGLLMFSPANATAQLLYAPKVLKIQVIAPPTLNLINDNRLAEAFVDRVRDTFTRSGFPLPIESVRPVEDPAKIPYALTINVASWKMDRSGNLDCTFTARLKTPQGTENLGVFSNAAVEWRGCVDHLGISSPIVDAKDEGFEHLHAEVLRSFFPPATVTELSA